jgi:hypothetical protein
MDIPLINEDDLITQALNAHGVFFKKSVRRAIERAGGINIISEEYPIKYMEGVSIDLLIHFSAKSINYTIPIECKRVYSSEWVFFKDPTGIAKIVYHLSPERMQAKFSTEINPLQDVTICIEGVEVDKRKFSSKNKNDIYKAASPTVIWEAAFQTCKANLGFVIQEFVHRQKYADELSKLGNFPHSIGFSGRPVSLRCGGLLKA